MKKIPMESTTQNGDERLAPVLAIAALVFLLLIAGCTTQPAAEPVAIPPATTVQTTAATTLMTVVPPATEELASSVADRAFADAADTCYRKTPVITNISTHLEFATCMKDTPVPSGNCARNYRYYVLKATNEDANSAGFARETNTARLAREAFLRGEGYDGIRQEYVPCGNATLIATTFYK